ncbi:hypothetical protein M433DRAFT_150926 [Acidomyces richmondensis BFW]|nr:MAG: hypothetical protein FE78DRAFT_84263 [Acidomyces sp. 'richmondensis']KYG48580.1 hypothetical protein M433DRAFT_150926 [Acidomyces richmondensis BFW]
MRCLGGLSKLLLSLPSLSLSLSSNLLFCFAFILCSSNGFGFTFPLNPYIPQCLLVTVQQQQRVKKKSEQTRLN